MSSTGERWNMSGKEYMAFQAICGAMSVLNDYHGWLKKRCQKAGKGIWAALRLMVTLAEKVFTALLATVPKEKMAHIAADVKNTRMIMKVEPPNVASRVRTEGFSYVPTDVLNDLMNHVISTECIACFKSEKEARRCPHRMLLERALPHGLPDAKGDECKFAGYATGLEDCRAEDESDD